MLNEIRKDKVLEFLLGGKAKFTVHNEQTKNQRKYLILAEYMYNGRVIKQRINDHCTVHRYVVYNIDTTKPRYIGELRWLFLEDQRWHYYPDYKYHAKEAQEFSWVYNMVLAGTIPNNIHILHHGSCSVCGRPLTDAESLERGIGPICLTRLEAQFLKLK